MQRTTLYTNFANKRFSARNNAAFDNGDLPIIWCPTVVVKLFICGARGPGFDFRSCHKDFRDWLSPASKLRYGWKIATMFICIASCDWYHITPVYGSMTLSQKLLYYGPQGIPQITLTWSQVQLFFFVGLQRISLRFVSHAFGYINVIAFTFFPSLSLQCTKKFEEKVAYLESLYVLNDKILKIKVVCR